MDDVLVLLQLIRLMGQRAEDKAQLMLAGRDLMVVLVDVHADIAHGRKHLGPHVLRRVDRRHREIAAFDARTMAHVAHLELGVSVPGSVGRIDLVAHLVDRVREPNVVEDEELGFRPPEGLIADAGGFQIGLRLDGGAARVALIQLARVRFCHVAMQAERFLREERVHVSGRKVRNQFHVGLVDGLPPGDGGAVEHEALGEEILIDLVLHDRDVLQLAARVGEADVDIGDVFILDFLNDIGSVAHWCFPSS